VAEVLEKNGKQDFHVENRPGGGGTVAPLAVSKAAPDGQTLLVTGIGSFVLGPAYADVGYRPMQDFTHIALLGGTPLVLVVNPKLPINDLKSFMAYAAAEKRGISWGSSGRGTLQHLIGEKFSSEANVPNMVSVNYKGDANILTDLLGGHIQASFMTLSAAKAHIKAGTVKPLAISSARRNAELKDIPTFSELGYPQLTATLWFCLSAPAGLPTELVEKLNLGVRQGFHQPEAQKILMGQDIEFHDVDPKETNRFIEAETLRWKLVK
jgi:tripartite-type tricarboxylate transporter receptor subunit TctC